MSPNAKPQKTDVADGSNGHRPSHWRELAKATAAEQDPAKVIERAKELIRALDAESNERMTRPHHGKRNDDTAA